MEDNNNDIIYIGTFHYDETKSKEIASLESKLMETKKEIREYREKLSRMISNIEEIERNQLKCSHCRKNYSEVTQSSGFSSLDCGHVFCNQCQIKYMLCPSCKTPILKRSKLFI